MENCKEIRRMLSAVFASLNHQKIIEVTLKGSFLFSVPYIFCMIIYPLRTGSYSNLHDVLMDWQTLNAGMVAYYAAALIYYAGKLDSDRKLKAQRLIDRALLSRGLLAASDYCESCISYFVHTANRFQLPENDLPEIDDIVYEKLSSSIASSESEISGVLFFMLQDIEVIRRRSVTAKSMVAGHLRTEPVLGKSHIEYINSLICIALSVKKASLSLLNYSRGISDHVSHVKDDDVIFLTISNPIYANAIKDYLVKTNRNLDLYVKKFADIRSENPSDH